MAKQPVSSAARRSPARPIDRTRGVQRRTVASGPKMPWGLPFGKTNLILLVAGLVAIVAGYMLMATGIAPDPSNNQGVWDNPSAVTFGPILCVIGYCVIIPMAIFYRTKEQKSASVENAVQ